LAGCSRFISSANQFVQTCHLQPSLCSQVPLRFPLASLSIETVVSVFMAIADGFYG
jgi:hypothetical protein